jgi:hypothetical protein
VAVQRQHGAAQQRLDRRRPPRESGGYWSINIGNGYYGGLQFGQSTWDAYVVDARTPRAEWLRGAGAWPMRGRDLSSGS